MNFEIVFEALKSLPMAALDLFVIFVAIPNAVWVIVYLCKRDKEQQAWKRVDALENALEMAKEKNAAQEQREADHNEWFSAMRKLHIAINIQKRITEFVTDVTDGKHAKTQANRLCEVFALLYDPWDQSQFQLAHNVLMEAGAAFNARMDVVLSENQRTLVVTAMWRNTNKMQCEVSKRFHLDHFGK
jgi:hypothetical protein